MLYSHFEYINNVRIVYNKIITKNKIVLYLLKSNNIFVRFKLPQHKSIFAKNFADKFIPRLTN